MITRNSLVSVLILLAGLAAGFLASRQVIDFLAISYQEKELSELSRTHPVPDSGSLELLLRMADMGGVGVMPDSSQWGNNYEHNQHVFEDMMLVNPPFIDTSAFYRERKKLAEYAGRMGRYGYNAVAIPLFLETINFDRAGNGRQVYGDESVYRQRHDSIAAWMGSLMELAAEKGLKTYLWTDMVALTTPLKTYFNDRFGSVDTENPLLWEMYGKAAEEAFEKFPHVEGIIIRIGEAGSVYNKPGWDYTSELYVRTGKAVRLMLNAFLEAAEKFDRTIIFRTWSVGVGEIGDLHTNPETYQQVLGEIESDHLVVSTKYCSGDFYSWHLFNPTLYQGAHRRMVEFQAKREFEGFGAIPNFVGPLYQSALQSFLGKNRNIEGVWVWTQYGGPLRAGPMIIYPFFGFNVINDINVFATSRLMMDPYADLDSLTGEWIRDTFGSDSMLVANLTQFMNASYGVMLKGLYISEFAKYEVRALGLEPPPMLWIFEWDILGASSAVFSHIYFITRNHFQEVTDEGLDAVRGAIALKELLLESRELVSQNLDDYDLLIASVDYEIELFRMLDYYRQFAMHYYRWVDTGDPNSEGKYKLAMGQFKAIAQYHEKKFKGNMNTLGIDFSEAKKGVSVTENTGRSIRWARVVLVVALFLLVMGIPGFVRDRAHRKFAGTLYFDALFRPYRISDMDAFHGTRRMVVFLFMLYLLSLVVFSSFSAFWFPLAFGLLSLVFITGLTVIISSRKQMGQILVTLLAPKVIIMALILFIVSIRGPMYFWYQFWISDMFRMIFLSIWFMLVFWKFQIYVIMVRKWSHRNNTASRALVLFFLGVQLLVAGVALKWVGLEECLTALNNELLVLPGGLSKIMGITTHLGIPPELPEWLVWGASGMTVISLLVMLVNRRLSRRKRLRIA